MGDAIGRPVGSQQEDEKLPPMDLTLAGHRARITGEQEALHLVATLIGGSAPPEQVFAAVAEEVGRHLGADYTAMSRFDPDGAATVVAAWTSTGEEHPMPRGTRLKPREHTLHTRIFQTRRPARIDNYGDATGEAHLNQEWGIRSVVGVPVILDGNLWGLIGVASIRDSLPDETEGWMTGVLDLVATAIANAEAQQELRSHVEEESALRRIAELVAQAVPPEDVFATVAIEAGRLLGSSFTVLGRYDPDGMMTVVAARSRSGKAVAIPVGTRWNLGGRNVMSMILRTGKPHRLDDYTEASGDIADVARDLEVESVVGAPIKVEGRLWGAIAAVSRRGRWLPAGSEVRLTRFTELVATAVANAHTRVELRAHAEEQSALRRVATLVARAAPSEEVFAAVAEEAGKVLNVEFAVLSRYDADGSPTAVGTWARSDNRWMEVVGRRWKPGGHNVHALVFETARPARIDDYSVASGDASNLAREWALRSVVGAPISVEGRLWGMVSVASAAPEPLPSDTESRLAGFGELVGTAVANAEAQAALMASRARIVAAADTTRRQIERDLHDGAQQQLVSLALQLRAAQEMVPPDAVELGDRIAVVADRLTGVVDELREMARGIHPAVLAEGGLRAGCGTLARRSAIPVRLRVGIDRRLPEQVELAAYYVVAEALTNAAKHSNATVIDVEVVIVDGTLTVCVRDDGCGGADVGRGSGLVGLTDRIGTLDGRMSLSSPPGCGTTLTIELPVGIQ